MLCSVTTVKSLLSRLRTVIASISWHFYVATMQILAGQVKVGEYCCKTQLTVRNLFDILTLTFVLVENWPMLKTLTVSLVSFSLS